MREPLIDAGAPRRAIVAWPTACLLIGALAGYAIFVQRTFLSGDTMVFDPYVPALKLAGNDLRITLAHSAILFTGQPYYPAVPIPYPPLALLLLYPLAVADFFTAYRIVVVLTIAGFLWLTLGLAGRFAQRPTYDAPAMFLAGVGLLSYPFQFEIERGQWNVIAVALALTAASMFHSRSTAWTRVAACALFVAGAHLKVYPALLVVAFWRRSEPFTRNVAWLAGITALTCAAVFVLGGRLASSFLGVVIPYAGAPYVWVGNHSIQAFATSAGVSSLPSFALVGVMLGMVAFRLIRRDVDGCHPLILAALMLAMLLLPSTSHDYTLSVLPAAMSLIFGWMMGAAPQWSASGRRWLGGTVIAVAASAAYHVALVPYTAKTQYGPWSMNPHPAIMVLVVLLSLALLTAVGGVPFARHDEGAP